MTLSGVVVLDSCLGGDDPSRSCGEVDLGGREDALEDRESVVGIERVIHAGHASLVEDDLARCSKRGISEAEGERRKRRTASVASDADEREGVVELNEGLLVLLAARPLLERRGGSSGERHVDLELDTVVRTVAVLGDVGNLGRSDQQRDVQREEGVRTAVMMEPSQGLIVWS